MKTTAIVCAIAAASLGFGSVSFAQGNDWRSNQREQPQRQQQQGQHGQQWQRPSQAPNPQRYERDMDRYANRPGDHRDDGYYGSRNDRRDSYNARGPDFRRGGYIPREYRNRPYVVNNYRSYRLSAPPRGQQWVQVGSDFVLIAIATGLIAQIVLNN